MIRTILAAAAALLSTACVTDPAKTLITPQSRGGMILLTVEPVPEPYTVSLKSYSKTEHKRTGDYHAFFVEPSEQRQVMAIEAPAGTYVFQDIRQQVVLAVCFHNDSLAFDLHPGEVVHLGVLDAGVNVNQLKHLALESGRTTANGITLNNFLEGIKPPAIYSASDADLAAARTYLASARPLVTSPIQPAQFQPARFGAGKDIFGIQDSCGGWYTGSAKPN